MRSILLAAVVVAYCLAATVSAQMLPASPAGDLPCEQILHAAGRTACYDLLMAQGTKPKARPSPIAAADDATCTPQVTHRLGADLWWEPAPATSGASVLIGYRLQRQVNEQRQWQEVVDVAATVLKYTVDGVTPPVRPGNTYRYRVLALWQPPDGAAVVASEAGVYGEPQPCFQVLTLPPPGLLRATPKG